MNKLLSCRYNMDTNRVEARFADGTTFAIDCIAIEDEYGNTPAQRAELDWLLYNCFVSILSDSNEIYLLDTQENELSDVRYQNHSLLLRW